MQAVFVFYGYVFIPDHSFKRMSMLQIVFSMPRHVYRFVWNGILLSFMELLFFVKIGADDIFVFTDALKQSKFIENTDNKLQRLQFARKFELRQLYLILLLLPVAFSATAISPAMPISSFGIYGINYNLQLYFCSYIYACSYDNIYYLCNQMVFL